MYNARMPAEDKTIQNTFRENSLNDNRIVDIEMQVAAQLFWKERLLNYLCRSFGKLNSGDDYSRTKAAVHIGILDFKLFPGEKQLYSENILKDKNTNRVYSDKLALNVLSLRNIEYATEEERSSGLYRWARFFSANTWEELKMAATSEAMQSAVVTLRKLTADERIRQQCQAREDYERDNRTWQALIRQAETKWQKAETEKQHAEAKLQKAEAKWQEAEAKNQQLLDLLKEKFSLSEDEIRKMMG